MTLTWASLLALTVRSPSDAARIVLSVVLDRGQLYGAVVATSALNVLLNYLFLVLVFPLLFPDLPADVLRPNAPVVSFLLTSGSLILFANILAWTGRAMGGQGRVEDMLKLLTWLQLVGFVLQAAGLLLIITLPLLAGFYGILVAGLSLWMVLSFIRVGHGFDGVGTAVAVLFISLIGIILGVSMLASLLGLGV